jgi:hypothetical protein
MHADAGRFRRSRIKRDQGTQKQEAGGGQETAVHDGCLHDFVGVAVGVALRKAGSTGRLTSGPARPAIFGIEPEPIALSFRTRPFLSGCMPNQMLTFRPCPRKLPGTQETD